MSYRDLGFVSYNAYLRSPHWRDIKRRYRESQLPQYCIACLNPSFQLHHRSYVRIGSELLTDLIPLCHKCHSKLHQYADKNKIHLRDVRKALVGLGLITNHQYLLRMRAFTDNDDKIDWARKQVPTTVSYRKPPPIILKIYCLGANDVAIAKMIYYVSLHKDRDLTLKTDCPILVDIANGKPVDQTNPYISQLVSLVNKYNPTIRV